MVKHTLVITDTHLHGRNEHYDARIIRCILEGSTVVTFNDMEFNILEGEVILIGDIIELQNVLKKHVKRSKQDIANLRRIMGKYYLSGNHELASFNLSLALGPILLRHGDVELWGKKKSSKHRKKKPGRSRFKYFFLVPLFEKIRNIKKFKLKADQMKRIRTVLNGKPQNHYLCGHTHILKATTYDLGKGKTATLLQRGANVFKFGEWA